MKKMESGSNLISADKRGKSTNNPRKILPATKDAVLLHIDSYQGLPAHFCRKHTSKTYLDPKNSVRSIYRDYLRKEKELNVPHISEACFRQIFKTERNIAFQVPKKDLCSECATYDNIPLINRTEEVIYNFELHIANKDMIRAQMECDKALINPTICCANFDLQKVKALPDCRVGDIYYLRTISVYNFTIYNMKSKECICNVWNQTVANRGALEMSTCVWKFIEAQAARGIKEIRFYCDNCGGQNRNKIMMSMLSRAAVQFKLKIVLK